VLAWRRGDADDQVIVAINMADQAVEVPLTGTVLVASHLDDEGRPFPGRLAVDSAVLLRPA
jgi:hypothetical protein